MLRMERRIYYMILGYSSRLTVAPRGFHGFGCYRQAVLEEAHRYWNSTDLNFRQCLSSVIARRLCPGRKATESLFISRLGILARGSECPHFRGCRCQPACAEHRQWWPGIGDSPGTSVADHCSAGQQRLSRRCANDDGTGASKLRGADADVCCSFPSDRGPADGRAQAESAVPNHRHRFTT